MQRWNVPLTCIAASFIALGCPEQRGGAPPRAEPPLLTPPTPPIGPGAAPPSPGMRAVEVVELRPRELGGRLLLLREQKGRRRVAPMVIGETEANAISLRLGGQKFARPLTHDLLETVLHTYGVSVVKLEIGEIQQTTFIGRLSLRGPDGKVVQLDARPSDGTALALGAGAPIFISATVLDQIGEPAAAWQLAPGAAGF
jgi:bifunctional DNase/RNase